VSGEIHPSLRRNASDHAHDLLVALASAVDIHAPGWGSAFGYLVGEVIPNRREERFAEYLTKLGQKLAQLNREVDLLRDLGPERTALFEDGAREAARSTTTERIERIAGVVAAGLSLDENQASIARELLAVFANLSDAEVATLASYAGVQPQASPQSEPPLERAVIMEAMREHQTRLKLRTSRLLSLGLLEEHQALVAENYRLNDRTGQRLVKNPPTVSPLGYAVLMEIGLLERR
jgi:hypothetical protein